MNKGTGNRDSKGGSLHSAREHLPRTGLQMEIIGQNANRRWYALRVRSQHEDVVARHLHVRGMESFLPIYKRKHKWSDRFKEVEEPLFPGYVFCLFDPANRLPVLTVPGVVHVVGSGKKPLPVDETEIAALQAAVRSGLPTRPTAFLEIGQRVKIACGPLGGLEGILLGYKGHERIVLSITLLQRSVVVEIDGAWIHPTSLKQGCSGRSFTHTASSQHSTL